MTAKTHSPISVEIVARNDGKDFSASCPFRRSIHPGRSPAKGPDALCIERVECSMEMAVRRPPFLAFRRSCAELAAIADPSTMWSSVTKQKAQSGGTERALAFFKGEGR